MNDSLRAFIYFLIPPTSLTDFLFFAFLFAAGILYYGVGALIKNAQKYILLLISLFFYVITSGIPVSKLFLIIFYVTFITYAGALLTEKTSKKIFTYLSISALAAALFFLKDLYNLLAWFYSLAGATPADIEWRFERLHFFSLIGLSYYTLSAIGYILDVSWGSYKAERNPFKIMLYICYFPQLISGPITRYSQMRGQFNSYHALEYENIAYGLRRMIWGYFKKLIISERFGIIVSAIYSHYTEYNGAFIVFATLCYAVQLYTDFSGCMDIIMGASNLFGVNLPENFEAPFFSLSLREFWQRWHISLGIWFKDYVLYPVQMSKFMVNIGKSCKKKFGKKAGKKIPFYMSLFVLWFLMGLWHGGTAHYFVASGMIPFILLTSGDILQPLSNNFIKFANINTENVFYKLLRRLRTLLLMCISFVFICSASVVKGLDAFKIIFLNFASPINPQFTLKNYLSGADIILMCLGLFILLFADYLKNNKSSLTEFIDNQRPVFQYAFLYAEILLIMFFAMLGNSSFIYFQF